jgi:[calcium/calmodulin-dependent protein kinase] kinase
VNKAHKQLPEECTHYDELTIKHIAKGLVSALEALHELNIVHRDIKPQNVLIDELGSPRLTDFGKSRQLSSPAEDLTTSMEGTLVFYPPESCSFEEFEQKAYSMKKADIWALGITLYCMTFNKMPFSIEGDSLEVMERICSHRLTFEEREISSELQHFLTMILDKDPISRATLSELKNSKFLNTTTSSQQFGFCHQSTASSMSLSTQDSSFFDSPEPQQKSRDSFHFLISKCSLQSMDSMEKQMNLELDFFSY